MRGPQDFFKKHINEVMGKWKEPNYLKVVIIIIITAVTIAYFHSAGEK